VISQEEDCYYQCDESEVGSFQEVAGVGCSSQANSSSSSLVVERCSEVEVDDTSSDARRIDALVRMHLLNEEVNREMHGGDQEEDGGYQCYELDAESFQEGVGVGCSSQADSSSTSLVVERCSEVEVGAVSSRARHMAALVQMCLLKEEVSQRDYT
ncbi:hypothetical protein, partial [Candidatus Ichthyocystis hellenicum]|uniref:hypothetical protein n=1 Tax=Candidatus Ichthyocystis hellenicum TaxID=1561003 RepID=UPI00158523D4